MRILFENVGNGDTVYLVDKKEQTIKERELIGSKLTGNNNQNIFLYFSASDYRDVWKYGSKDESRTSNLVIFSNKDDAISYFLEMIEKIVGELSWFMQDYSKKGDK